MPEELLHNLGRQLAPSPFLRVDAPGREEMPEGVQGIFRLAVLVHHASVNHDRFEAAQHIRMVLDLAGAGGEYKIAFPLRAGQFPLFEGGDQHVSVERNGAAAGLRLWRTDSIDTVGALAHMQFTGLQVYIFPSEATKLARAQPG